MYGDDPSPNKHHQKNNADMTDAQIAFSIAALKKYGMVDSGEALKHGIGAMSDERMKKLLR